MIPFIVESYPVLPSPYLHNPESDITEIDEQIIIIDRIWWAYYFLPTINIDITAIIGKLNPLIIYSVDSEHWFMPIFNNIISKN